MQGMAEIEILRRGGGARDDADVGGRIGVGI
jgi:hypothetical protein